MVSYAQNGEDVVLNRAFKGQLGFYVDIGASFPTLNSVTKHFYDLGWTGINVEPIPKVFEILNKERKNDINLNCAVGTFEGEAEMVVFPDTSECSSLNPNFTDYHGAKKIKIKVPVRSLDSILKEHAKDREIDFLKIDVEGNEGDVLKSVDLKKWKPKVIIVEVITHGINADINKEWENAIIEAGYVFTLYDGINKFFARKDLPEIIKDISTPVNVLDSYRPARYLSLIPKEVIRSEYEKLVKKGKISEDELKSLIDFEKNVGQLHLEKNFKYDD